MNDPSAPSPSVATPVPLAEGDLARADALAAMGTRLTAALSQVIVGQHDVVRQVLVALLCQGHCILEGVPGLAKTLLIQSLARLLHLDFRRIQFTPDLMPSDITGMEILEEEEGTGRRRLKFLPGPIFGHLILGDEINRTPPKTQAALLQAMQEARVTVAGQDYELERPFVVLGTQNPIEQEGTYPLPEAQLDRFLFKILIDYPSRAEELAIAESTTSQSPIVLEPLVERAEILAYQALVRKVIVGRSLAEYVVELVRATRPNREDAPDFINRYLTWGAGPRASQAILLSAKAHALLSGRVHVSLADIRYVTPPVLRHRLVTSFTAQSDGVSVEEVIRRLFAKIRSPETV